MKGNMFLGYARGSVGDVTFARIKGQQTARARNRQPANPRTSGQMTQRTMFMSAVKFYSRGVQNLFKFAFEGRKSAESDYNAFMRLNSSQGMYMKKADFDSKIYPAVGNWTLSQGSLSGITQEEWDNVNNKAIFTIGSTSETTAPTTVGALAALLIQTGRWQINDIVTTLRITSNGVAGSVSEPITGLIVAPQWDIRQFIVDTTDETALSNYGIAAEIASGVLRLTRSLGTSSISGGAIIQSRRTDNGLRVSTSKLINNAQATTAIGYGNSPEWKSEVLADWSAREPAILEGSEVAVTGGRSIALASHGLEDEDE